MDVLVLIDKLDDQIHNAKPVPLTDQVRVDKEEIYDILDQMRATIPEEIKQARWIVKERQEMLAEAKREAERIVKEARDEQTRLISEPGGHQAGRAPGRRDRRGRPRARARDPPGRRGLRRRHPQHPRGEPPEVHRGRPARPRPAPGPRRSRSRLGRRTGAPAPKLDICTVGEPPLPVLQSLQDSYSPVAGPGGGRNQETPMQDELVTFHVIEPGRSSRPTLFEVSMIVEPDTRLACRNATRTPGST